MKMKMNISELFFSWHLNKKADVDACSDSSPLPAADADEISVSKDYRDRLKERKKLCLVINLDNVLIDLINLCDLTRYDIFYFSNSGVQTFYKEGQLHTLFYPPKIKNKLSLTFEVSSKTWSLEYDIVLYSKRYPTYTDRIRKLLNPDGAISLTVISLGNSKSAQHHPQLKPLLLDPDLLVILDDTEKGWDKKYCKNLIKVSPYPYFNRPKMKNKSWTILKGDECEKGGELYRICHPLGSLHNIIYNPNRDFHDTRQVIQKFCSNNCLDNFHLCYVGPH